MNEESVPIPAVYKQGKGCTRDWFPEGKKGGWNTSMVAKIIRDERYAGHMVSGKKAYESFDSRRQVGVDRSEWIVVRDTHEGIVTQEEFDRANGNMRSVAQGRKRELDIRRQEVSAAVSEAEAREAVEESGKREYREALRIREYLHLEGYDKRVMASLIESAKVMGEDRLEVVWKFGDVYEKILGEMR